MKNQYKAFFQSKLKRAMLSFGLLATIGLGNANAQISLTATLGTTSGSYTDISSAFAAINAGTHKGAIVINVTNNTTEPAPVTALFGSGTASASASSYTSVRIQPSGGSWTINSAATPTANRGVIELAGADNVTIDGDPTNSGTRKLTIAAATSTNITAAIRISSNNTSGTDGANNDTVKNCIILGSRNSATSTNTNYGIVICNYSTTSLTTGAYGNNTNVIENNEIKRTYRGIYHIGASTLYPNNGLRIRNNILGSSVPADNIGQYGLYFSYTATSTTASATNSAIIEGNDIQVGDYTTGVSTNIAGIYLTSYNDGMIIRKNNVHDIYNSSTGLWGSYGIQIVSSLNNNLTIENNFIRDVTNNSNSATPAYVYQNHGIYITSVGTGLKINHNTIYLNKANVATYSSGSLASTASSSCLTFTSATPVASQVYNNIFINNLGGVSSNSFCVVTSGTANLPSTTNNNLYYAPSSGKVGYYGGSAISTLSAWQSTTGLDASSISESVSFTSATDLHIPTGTTSLCESGGAATSVTGVTDDIDNTTRPGTSTYGFGTAPDIGADEFNGQVIYTCTTPAPGATIKSPTSLCYGNSMTLSLTTATSGTGVKYQWQTGPTSTGPWTDITSATAATQTVTPTGSEFYRCKVKCLAGPDSTYSTAVQATYTYNVLTTTNGVRCGTGPVSLSATGTSGGTFKWYTTATGGASVGSGSPFTPTVAATTNYYVSNEASTSGTAVVPSGTTTANSNSGQTPFGQVWESGHTQHLVLASDLVAAGFGPGNISSLSFYVTSKSSYLNYDAFTIKFAHTTATSLTGILSPTFTTVYGGSSTSYSSVSGANNFTFSTAFNWDGTSNVLVDVCFDNATSGTSWSNNDAVSFVAKSYTATYGIYNDGVNLCGASSGGSTSSANALPQMTLNGTLTCASPRQLVTATVNTAPAFAITGTQTVCNNSVAAMSVTSPLTNYNTYIWTPTTGLFTDAGCTVAYVSGASASTVYAKTTTAGTIKYFCTANNTTSLCSGLDSASVTNLPSTVSVTATPANLCYSGNTTLTISPSSGYGAAQFQWQSSSDNATWSDSVGRTSTTLTTALVSNSRYYRVVLRNGTGTFCLNSASDTALVLKPSVVTVTDGVRCAPGTVVIGATATDGTINWYAAASGGSLLGTGNSFTTPSISSTTTYYAETRATPDASITTGTGGTTLNGDGLTPFSLYWESARTQYLLTATELTSLGVTAGGVNSMSFNVTSKSSSAAFNGYTIKFANTSATSLASGYLTPTFTTVYGPSNYTTATGTNNFNLTGGFAWDGTSNLLIEICFSNSGLGYSGTDAVTATSKSYVGTYGSYDDGAYLCSSTGYTTSSSVVPDFTFTRQGCVSSRSPVVATVNPLPTPTISPATGPIQICAGSTTTLTGAGGGNYQWKNAAGDIAGAMSSTYTTGTTGTYRVVVTNPTTGCKDSTAFVGVNVNPVPTVSIAPAATTQICSDSSQKFTSVVTGSGLTYQWFNSGTTITGATKDTLRVSTAGVYTLRVYLGTCSDTSNEATLVVNPLPAASFTKTGTTGAICLGQTFELTALTVPASSSYQWSLNGVDIPGATSRIFNASIGGIYTVRIKDGNNCRKTSDTASLINTPMGVPNLSPKEARFCEGTILKLYSNAGPFASKFAWTRNGVSLTDTTAEILSAIDGTYDVTVTDVYGCTLLSPKTTLSVDPLPTKPVINKIGTTLTTVAPYNTYQWYRNGKAIPGATFRNFTMIFDGNYHVVVTNAFDCINVSDTLSVQALSVKQLSRDDINIDVYPNPSQSIINIAAPIAVNVMVQDVQGKKILSLQNATQVDMSIYADGIYIFTITDKDGVVLKMDKVVKRTN